MVNRRKFSSLIQVRGIKIRLKQYTEQVSNRPYFSLVCVLSFQILSQQWYHQYLASVWSVFSPEIRVYTGTKFCGWWLLLCVAVLKGISDGLSRGKKPEEMDQLVKSYIFDHFTIGFSKHTSHLPWNILCAGKWSMENAYEASTGIWSWK